MAQRRVRATELFKHFPAERGQGEPGCPRNACVQANRSFARTRLYAGIAVAQRSQINSLYTVMETLESSRVCRLCGKLSGCISINIFDKNESHVKKINAVLPIMVRHICIFSSHTILSLRRFPTT